MSSFIDPQYVEAMWKERSVKPKDIEMDLFYAEVQAEKRGRRVRRPGLLSRLQNVLLATWRRRPQRSV
jgi:hypothetical protein